MRDLPSPFARLSFFYAAGPDGGDSVFAPAIEAPRAETPLAYPFAPDEAADAAARRLATSLRSSPASRRAPLLRVWQAQSALLPWSAVHPSWLEDVLADCQQQWRVWALAVLPEPLRARLQTDRPEALGALLHEAQPPPWWAEWFTAHVKRRLAYPDLDPWNQAPLTDALPGSLWEHSEPALTRLLAVHGTRGFVSAIRQLPREKAQEWLWRLPAQCQEVAEETVRERRWSDDPFWPAIFEDLAEECPEVEARLFRIALGDFLRAGLLQGQEAPLRRLAFRLPRRWGEWMLRELTARPEWLFLPMHEGLAAWRQRLAADLDLAGAAGGHS
jgi:hypothetical protein